MVMEVVIMMLAVTACYTITSLSDKYAVSKAKFTSCEFTFLMCSSMSVFLTFTLPFQQLYFSFTPQSFVAIFLIIMCKLLEFTMSAIVLKMLSAFELKAWLGVTLVISYITDVLYGGELLLQKIFCIFLTVTGLVFIARSSKDGETQYKKIIIPLAFYILAKYGYGLVIKAFSTYVCSTLQLLPALIVISVVMLFVINPKEVFKKNKTGATKVILARIPNALGMLLENAVIAISLANYSFIQPMILVTLFFIGLLRRENSSKSAVAGSIICVIGAVMFQVV